MSVMCVGVAVALRFGSTGQSAARARAALAAHLHEPPDSAPEDRMSLYSSMANTVIAQALCALKASFYVNHP